MIKSTVPSSKNNRRDWSWKFWLAVPIYPYGKRQTIRKEVIKDTIWTFDQIQGIFYVTVPIRMTIAKLKTGGLFVYAPVAPTPECIRLVRELEEKHGEVKYIILPTISAVEHKVFVGPFARQFKKAQVFVAPNQWSFPLNLPLSWLGFPPKRTHFLPEDSSQTPFADQFDYAMLGAIELGLGKFEEVAFFDKDSQTLFVTDSVLSIPEEPPEIVKLDPYPLLFHARDHAGDVVSSSPDTYIKGWQRISLFTLYFRPSVLDTIPWKKAIKESRRGSDRSKKGYFGLFPFRWKENWKDSFEALRGNGRLLVAPILQTLILNRAPQETINWANKVASWNFQRIIPCHFDAPIEASPDEFRQAFAFLEQKHSIYKDGRIISLSLPEEDLELLRELDEGLQKWRVIPPASQE